ncbi:MAG: hypothetical protein COA33_000365 [Fluviicola sp.]|nr:hypothetical protein [Fluviicola sp.]
MTVLLSHSEKKSNKGIGGKAKNLIQLEKIGANVPKWAVIPQEVLLQQLSESVSENDIADAFSKLDVPPTILTHLHEFFSEKDCQKSYAVRSSAIDEDGASFSFAGQFETFLHVPFEELESKIKLIWKSTASKRVLRYRKENKLPLNFGIGVIVQEMIDADVAGVAFGANPISGDTESKVISAVFGLGEGLVSGELNADTFTLSPSGIHKDIAEKTHLFVRKNDSGIQKIELEKERKNSATLDDNQLHEIATLLDQLTKELKAPQDIEFAYKEKSLHLLQTRPITTIKASQSEEYILWDNSNIIESYPGITTPLTYSFILKMYEMVYRQFVGIMGVKEREIDKHAEIFANTLGLVRGRVYYNLLNWYKMLAMLPGYSINAENMERMMGVKEKFELEDDFQMSKGIARLRIIQMYWKMIVMQIKLPRQRKRFMKQLNAIMNQYKSIDFSTLSTKEIVDLYISFEKSLLLKWKAPLTNDFFAMIWFGMLEKKTKKYCPNEPNLHNDLLCGSQDIISVEPIHRSIELSASITKNEDARRLFSEKTPLEIWTELEKGAFPEIKNAFDEYIDKFGDRCVGELKLETISYSQQPELLVKVIKSYVEQGITQKKSNPKVEDDVRINAENKIDEALKGQPLKKWWYNYILNKTRDLVSNRENLRYQRTRGFGMVRNMFSALGENLHSDKLIASPRDVFYLELNEIKKLKENAFSPELSELILERKEEFNAFKKQEMPQERFFTYGNNFTDEYIYSLEKIEKAEEDLSGIGCCPGIVKGTVRIVIDPNEIDSLNGDILVTSSTDPGWVILFPTASAIIVERGSLLSHSAIVSREMGIPCIVSVSGLLRTLKTGDQILMDGSTGKIKLLNET